MREEQQLVSEFMQERPTMARANSDPRLMMQLLQNEVDELKVEIEAGDHNKIAGELPDVVWFCLTIAEIYGIDLENALWAKGIRNQEKYPTEYFGGEMTYEEAHTICRALWAQNGNDDSFLQLSQS